MLDDAHRFGVMGPEGHGTGKHFSLQNEIDLYFSTFAKAFANIGGITAGPQEVLSYMSRNTKASIFTHVLPN
ncbi:aminotransferase class I/II-fold pyridoxal phosphate-dependent enzyme [Candidatus Coxiella mudrowiae]|uniref:aminotransferase class I/II-fold pyridoxal phosphate-dependent enzyme n=1 Tax=Candidatus Coxiella mudrowiae TaxID=2054173 RepID=UPI000662AD86|nr:aminotransferase class I/II-fold pyridoxal phosphate-dependent enzyme [Candidatus Coxiella mudrowiae]